MTERVLFSNSRKLSLVGLLSVVDSEKIVVFAHGFTGDKYEHGRFIRIAQVLNAAGISTLLFDFSGSGESDDDLLLVKNQVDDLSCALDFVQEKGFSRIGLYGHSLGGLVCFYSDLSQIKTIVASAPVCAQTSSYEKKRMDKYVLVDGMYERHRSDDVRKVIRISPELFVEREQVDQESLLQNVSCPVFIIHGKADDAVPFENSMSAMQYLSSDSELLLVDDMTHDTYADYDFVLGRIVSWYNTHI